MKLIYPKRIVLKHSIEDKEYVITNKTEIEMYNFAGKDSPFYPEGIIIRMDGINMREYRGENNTGV